MRQTAARHYVTTILTLASVLSLPYPWTAQAQLPEDAALCFQFDRAYFAWTVETFLGDSSLLDSLSVVRDSFEIPSRTVPQGLHLKVLSDSSVVPWRVVSGDSTAIVMLSPNPHKRNRLPGSFPPGARTLILPAMQVDSMERYRWLDFSYWHVVPGDTLELAWRNGLHGPVFLLEVRGDTLQGRVRFTTDIVGREPRQEDARALRVACPS